MTARRLTRIALASVVVAAAVAGVAIGCRASAAVRRDQAALAVVAARKPVDLLQMRAAEEARLQAGPVPIEEAMRRLADRGRDGLGTALTPQPSNDTAPLIGWGYQMHEVPDWVMAGDAGP